ncbi:MAG: DDE-type integrase/transposase/recombinase [Planctomycetota bacterium]
MTEEALQDEVLRLRRQVGRLPAIARILFACFRALGMDLTRRRVPDGPSKAALLRAVERGRDVLPPRKALTMIGLSASRLHAWKRAERGCDLDDHPSCPKTSPHRVTPGEVAAIKEMVTSPDYRHVPTGTLAVLAQRIGRIFALATTWRRLVRERGWRRPRTRVHPARPKVGIRAARPDETWHIDTTIIRLVDGSKAYLHAVIDNFSRRILSWRIGGSFDTSNTVAVLTEACRSSSSADGDPPTVLADGESRTSTEASTSWLSRGCSAGCSP